MANKTLNDLPDILNSISWQLKRIADHLDKEQLKPSVSPMSSPIRKSAREMIRNLKVEKE